MRKFGLLCASFACFASAAVAAPLTVRHPQNDEILVLGQRNPGDAARDFVRSLALPSADRQLADFAAMQLFARTRPQFEATQPAPTILILLDDAATGRPAPLSLTGWDLAYLKALYSYTDRYSAGAERGDLARRMSHFISSDAPLQN